MFQSLYIKNKAFLILLIIILLFILGSFGSLFFVLAQVGLIILLVAVSIEIYLLYFVKIGVSGFRELAPHLSNGDNNDVYLHLKNDHSFLVWFKIIDEVPIQFQVRDKTFTTSVEKNKSTTIQYTLRPTQRGEYHFGNILVFVATRLALVERKYTIEAKSVVPVYPSYLQLKKYRFLAVSNHLHEYGIKQVRKVGHNYEFDQIREYIEGDDYRSINWKATAKTNHLMVNQYQDEKSQHVYALINMGRLMKMPFEGLSLLDYAINSTLVFLNTAYVKDDKPGMITFNKKVQSVLPSKKDPVQMKRVLQTLYNQKTDYSEADYESLYFQVRNTIKQRSLVFLFTNFESLISLKRELLTLRSMAKHHLLVVVLFKNTELQSLFVDQAKDTEQIYTKTIARKFIYEKELIAKELLRYGIQSLLTDPKNLTVDAINKYLELKARRMV